MRDSIGWGFVTKVSGLIMMLVVLSSCSTTPQQPEPQDNPEPILKNYRTTRFLESSDSGNMGSYDATYPGSKVSHLMGWGSSAHPLLKEYKVSLHKLTELGDREFEYLVQNNYLAREKSDQYRQSGSKYILLRMDADLDQMVRSINEQTQHSKELYRYLTNPSFEVVTSVVYLLNYDLYNKLVNDEGSDAALFKYDDQYKTASIQLDAATMLVPDSGLIAYRAHYICNTTRPIELCEEPGREGKAIIAKEGKQGSDTARLGRVAAGVVLAPVAAAALVMRVLEVALIFLLVVGVLTGF